MGPPSLIDCGKCREGAENSIIDGDKRAEAVDEMGLAVNREFAIFPTKATMRTA